MQSAEPIHDEAEYRRTLHELTHRERPALVLRLLMNAVERYRQSRKIGWSRPQNKYGVTTFHVFELDLTADRAIVGKTAELLWSEFPPLTSEQRTFVEGLLQASDSKGFVFVHDIEQGGRRFEGVTVSLGRVVPEAPRHRHRFDAIVEREVIRGAGTDVVRARAYIDPFRLPLDANPPLELVLDAPGPRARKLLDAASAFYGRYAQVPEKAWRHWTQDYIEYFGPRLVPVVGTLFPTAIDLAAARAHARPDVVTAAAR